MKASIKITMSGTTGSQDIGDKLATPSAQATPPAAVPDRFARLLSWSAVAGIIIALLIMVAASAVRNCWEHPYLVLPDGGFPWALSAHKALLPEATWALWAAALLGGASVAAGLAALSRGARPPVRLLLAAGLVAAAAFTITPPTGSTDALDYAAYGRIVVLGHSPYVMTPEKLRLVQGERPGKPPGGQHDVGMFPAVAHERGRDHDQQGDDDPARRRPGEEPGKAIRGGARR